MSLIHLPSPLPRIIPRPIFTAFCSRSPFTLTHVDLYRSPPIDPLAEIQKIRQSIASIERHIRYAQSIVSSDTHTGNSNISPPGSQAGASSSSAKVALNKLTDEVEVKPEIAVSGPGAYGRQTRGLYVGPTSTSSHLFGVCSSLGRCSRA